jgi:voltage-gated potassium channel
MTSPAATSGRHGNAYNIFVLVLTVISLTVMVLLVLPLEPETIRLLEFYDNLIAFIFLTDFILNLKNAPSKKGYFFGERGWLDLLGSIPSLGISQYGGILRLARLSRFARIARLLRGKNRKQLVDDVLHHRSQYAVFITLLAAMLVLTFASAVVLQAESRSDESNINSGWDAFWWSFVTITTVGYGDRYPVTDVGRVAAMFVMLMGLGVIGALASILASVLVGSGSDANTAESSAPAAAPQQTALEQELAGVKAELAALRQLVERLDARGMPIEPPAERTERATRSPSG